MLTVLDLFSGIGGISLGLERTGGFKTVMFCEIEPFPRLVLKKHWPEVPIHEDVRTLSAATLGGLRPDCIVGGFPCQPFSVAGSRKAQEDDRHLWPEFYRLIRELQPRWVIGENVPGIRTAGAASGRSGADEVLEDLEALDYTCWPVVVGADDLEPPAPHRRKRVWFVGHCRGAGLERHWTNKGQGGSGNEASRSASAPGLSPCWIPCPGCCDDWWCERHELHAYDCECPGIEEWAEAGIDPYKYPQRWPARPGEPQHEWEEPRLAHTAEFRRESLREGTGGGGPSEGGEGDSRAERWASEQSSGGGRSGCLELPLGGATDGLPERLVRLARRANREALKAYGNSVVPQVVEAIGYAILKAEEGLR